MKICHGNALIKTSVEGPGTASGKRDMLSGDHYITVDMYNSRVLWLAAVVVLVALLVTGCSTPGHSLPDIHDVSPDLHRWCRSLLLRTPWKYQNVECTPISRRDINGGH